MAFCRASRYISLTNRAGFYSNNRVSTISSLSSDRAKPSGYRASCQTDWFIYIPDSWYYQEMLI
jgi:hypothetical protein